jgi:hypothetical protein
MGHAVGSGPACLDRHAASNPRPSCRRAVAGARLPTTVPGPRPRPAIGRDLHLEPNPLT